MEQELNREIDWLGLLAEVNDGEYKPEPVSKETEGNIDALVKNIPGLRPSGTTILSPEAETEIAALSANEKEASAIVDEKELAEITGDDDPDDLSIVDKEAAEKIAKKAKRAGTITSAKRRRIMARDISRFALEQKDVDLSEQIGKADLKALIAELTREFSDHMQEHIDAVTKMVRRVLIKRIPRYMKYAYENYRGACKRSPGFLYSFDDQWGHKQIWLSPDLPNCFEPGDEMVILSEDLDPVKTGAMQRRIDAYYRYAAKKRDEEVRIALTFARRHIKTYMDLLKENPFWWEIMYSIKTGNKVPNYETTLQ